MSEGNKKKNSKNVSFEGRVPETTKARVDYSKAQDFIYTNAFVIKKRGWSGRAKGRNLSVDVEDKNYELKAKVNRQQDEITRLKTQVQYATKELEKVAEESSFMDIGCLHKKMSTQKRVIEDLKDELQKKEEKIEDIKKKSKFFLVQELEAENSQLTEMCKKLNGEINTLLEEINKRNSVQVQEEEIQKSILISQLKKEKDRFKESIDEKNQEIMKWRDRVIELEKKEDKVQKKAKEKWKSKEREMLKEISLLKTQLETAKKHSEELEKKHEEKIAKLQLEFVSEKNAKKAKFSQDCVVRVKSLDPVPAILDFLQKKSQKLSCTLDQVFHKLIITYSNNPTISDFQSFIEIPDESRFCIEELITSLSQNAQISINNFSEFCHKVKFTPKPIQKLLRHLTLRFQLARIPRCNIPSLFTKVAALKNPENFHSLISSSPFNLDTHDARSLADYLYPQGLRFLKKTCIAALFASHFPCYSLLTDETESVFFTLLSSVVESQYNGILAYCKNLDVNNSGLVHLNGLQKCLESFGLPLSKELALYVALKAYSTSQKVNKVEYVKFLSMFVDDQERDVKKVLDFYLGMIREELSKKNLSVFEVFIERNKKVSGEDFIEGLAALGMDSIAPVHLSIILEALQFDGSQELCIDYSKLSNYLSNLQ